MVACSCCHPSPIVEHVNLRRKQLLLLWVLVAAPVALALILLPLASRLTVGWSARLIAIGLVFEIAGAWAVLVRSLVQDAPWTFSHIYTEEAEKLTKPMPIIGLSLLLLGFILQFVSVVFT